MTDFKIVLLGDYAVGKTSLVTKLLTDKFNDKSVSTIGASFRVWKTGIQKQRLFYKRDVKEYTIGIWDTAGQERFYSLIPMYLRNCNAVIYCWDINKVIDLEKVQSNYNNVMNYSPEAIFYLVFTKVDTNKDFKISPKVLSFVDELKLPDIIYTSSSTGEGVKELFNNIINKLVENPFGESNTKTTKSINLSDSANNNTKICCF